MISKNPIFNNVLFKIGFLETISNLLTIKTYLSTIINSIKIYTIGSKSYNKVCLGIVSDNEHLTGVNWSHRNNRPIYTVLYKFYRTISIITDSKTVIRSLSRVYNISKFAWHDLYLWKR